MMAAMRADVEILLEFQHVDQSAAVRALEPEAFWHVFTSIEAAQARFTENAHGNWKVAVGDGLPRRKSRGAEASRADA